ncbi:hypothetical protein RQP46_007175 [Phenoliferia psychrophenolica]
MTSSTEAGSGITNSLGKLFDKIPASLPPCAPPLLGAPPSLWQREFTSPLTSMGSEGPIPTKADIVIIGTGITGCSLAAKLVEGLLQSRADAGAPVMKIVLLDAREFCSGATGRNGGHLRPGPLIQFKTVATAYGVEEALKAVELEERSIQSVLSTCSAEGWTEDVELVSGGCVHFFEDQYFEDDSRSEVKAAEINGVDTSAIEWLTGAEALQKYGAKCHSAMHFPGNSIFPLKFITSLFSRTLAQVAAAGVDSPVDLSLFTATTVTSVDECKDKSSRWTVKTSRGALNTDYVIHCTNGYASSVIPSLASVIIPTRGQTLAFTPTPSSDRSFTTSFAASQAREYMIQRPNGQIVLGGGRHTALPPYEFGEARDDVVNDNISTELRTYLKEQWEGRIQGKVDYEWTGVMGYTRSGVPLVGPVYSIDGKVQEGQYISAGYSGHGMPRSPATAEAISMMVLSDLRGKKFVQPEWLPTFMLTLSLLDYISLALSTLPGQRDLAVQVVRSQPRRSHALFPHASNLKTKVWQEEVLVLLKERALGSTEARVPACALEASVYTIPATSTSLVYVSKVDTSGLGCSSPSPTRTLVAAFIEHALRHPPHATTRVRVHVFARAQGQYLFPGSIENPEKHVLDDKGLLRWWKSSLALAATRTAAANAADNNDAPVQLFYLIPGLSHAESLPYVPDTATPAWQYGHPYATVTSPLHLASAPPAPTTDFIPNFPDDPKARFITNLVSSAVASAGAPDDYDELVHALSSRSFASGTASATALEALNQERARERSRFLDGCPGGVDEWWERMAFRQECCSGTLVGFFVVVRDRPGADVEAPSVAPKPEATAVGHTIFTKLWSQFHNVDYARTGLEKCRAAADKWERDVELVVKSEGYDPVKPVEDQEEEESRRKRVTYEKEVWRELKVDNPALESKKRELPEPAKVNVMVPRKKVKK